MLKPRGAAGHPVPLVVLVHGGPTGRWTDVFEPWGQLLAARGYAVIYPNVRGSTGYGQRFVEMNRADWGGGDFKDVMAAVDWAVSAGLADANRLGIGGWSYGGYLSAWAVTQTDRFKAAVSGAPVIDLASEFGTEDDSAYRRVVLRNAVQKAGWLHPQLARRARQSGAHADATAAGRSRRDRSDRPEPAVLSRAEALRHRVGSRAVSRGRGTACVKRSTSWIASRGSSPGTSAT